MIAARPDCTIKTLPSLVAGVSSLLLGKKQSLLFQGLLGSGFRSRAGTGRRSRKTSPAELALGLVAGSDGGVPHVVRVSGPSTGQCLNRRRWPEHSDQRRSRGGGAPPLRQSAVCRFVSDFDVEVAVSMSLEDRADFEGVSPVHNGLSNVPAPPLQGTRTPSAEVDHWPSDAR